MRIEYNKTTATYLAQLEPEDNRFYFTVGTDTDKVKELFIKEMERRISEAIKFNLEFVE